MHRINTILLLAISTLYGKTFAQTTVKQKPNIVFILADDCTNWDLACYGSVDAYTPNIDTLAKQGIKFNRCYQAAPMSSPTRHNIYTGLYPIKSGAYPNHTCAYDNVKSLPHYLRPLGYRVALSGKRHIAPESVFPFEYLGETKEPEFDKVEKFLKDVKSKNEPFALMLCSHQPHSPWNMGDPSIFNQSKVTLPPFFINTKETRKAFCDYLAEITYLDGVVGQAINLLKKYGYDENTMIIFASEQGNSFPFAKWTCYEAGVKSALIAKFPPLIKANTQSNSIVEYTDLLPTFIDLAHGKTIEQLDGKSLVPIMKDPTKEIKEYAYSEQTTRGIYSGSDHYGIRSIVGKRYRYILNLTPEITFHNVVNNCPKNKNNYWYLSWKKKAKTDFRAQMIIDRFKYRPKEELYDVVKDKWCLHNLADDKAYSKIKQQLKNKLFEWMKDCGDKGEDTEMDAYNHMPKHMIK